MAKRLLINTLVGSYLALMSLAAVSQPGIDVIVQAVEQRQLQTKIEALGTLRANESIHLTSRVSETVTAIHFEDGQRVNHGDLLVELNNAEEQALLIEAKFNVDEANKQLDRVRSLVARNAAPASLLDQREREYQTARARQAALQARLDELQIKAPFSGVVGLRNISLGALVSPGSLITTLNDDSQMKLDFTVPAIYLRNLRVGLPIEARSRPLGDEVFIGEVSSIDNQIDPVTRALTVRALLPNKERQLTQGLLMTVNLFADERTALIISESALVPLGSNNFVFVVRQDGGRTVVERRLVIIGQRMEGTVEVLSGLEAGDRVVTHGLQKVRDGSVVNVIAEQTGDKSLSELLARPASGGNG